MTEPPGCGIHFDVPFSEYCEWDAVNISRLSAIAVSPKHYHAHVAKPDTKAMALGRAVHSATFEMKKFALNYTVWRGGVRHGKTWDAFAEANADKTILNEADFTLSNAICDSVNEHPIAGPILQSPGKAEVSLCWYDPATKIFCKGRLDWLPADRKVIRDLKTAVSIEAHAFTRACQRYNYYIRAAFYCDGLASLTFGHPQFEFIAVENTPPHDVAVYAIPQLAMRYGRETYLEWLHLLANCQKNNTWPGIAEDAIVEQPCNYIDVDGQVLAT